MNEKYEHSLERRRGESIPEWLKGLAAFINRIGFPIFAFCVLAYFTFVIQVKTTNVIGELRDVMLAVKASLESR